MFPYFQILYIIKNLRLKIRISGIGLASRVMREIGILFFIIEGTRRYTTTYMNNEYVLEINDYYHIIYTRTVKY